MEIVQSLSSCVLEVFLHEGNQGDFVHLFICVFHLLFFVLCLFGFIIGSTFSGQRTLIEELKVFLYPLIPSCAKFIWAAEIPSAAGCRGLQYVCCSGPSPSQFPEGQEKKMFTSLAQHCTMRIWQDKSPLIQFWSKKRQHFSNRKIFTEMLFFVTAQH